MIMAAPLSNLIQRHRASNGWSQDALARRTGLSRAAISAIETNRVVPSTVAALALAAAFGCRVEDLFRLGHAAQPGDPEWAWPACVDPCRLWRAVVGERTLLYPVERTFMGTLAADGRHHGGRFEFHPQVDADQTLVMAGCDPAVALLGRELARTAQARLLPLIRSSRDALELLRRKLVHVAGLHLQDHNAPGTNANAVRELLGPHYTLLRVACWQEGLALTPRLGIRTIRSATSTKLRWVVREKGSGARACLDTIFRGRRDVPGRFAHVATDHAGVVETIRTGFAQVGVCIRLCAVEAGLDFLTAREEDYDLCFHNDLQSDPRIAALIGAIRSRALRQSVGGLPGYHTREAGELVLSGRT